MHNHIHAWTFSDRDIEAFKKQLETTLFTAQNIEITLIPNLLLLVKE